MKLEDCLTVEELLAKKPDPSWVPVYKPTGVYYNEAVVYEKKEESQERSG